PPVSSRTTPPPHRAQPLIFFVLWLSCQPPEPLPVTLTLGGVAGDGLAAAGRLPIQPGAPPSPCPSRYRSGEWTRADEEQRGWRLATRDHGVRLQDAHAWAT